MTAIRQDVEAASRQFLESQTVPDGCTVLKINDSNESLKGVLRLPDAEQGPAVVKIWRCRQIRGRISQLLGLSNSSREWNIHCYAFGQGLALPEPLSIHRIWTSRWRSVDVMVVRELQDSVNAMSYFKQVLAAADRSAIDDFEDRLIRLTTAFINVGIIDIDHQLNNMLADRRGALFRIDFECARRNQAVKSRERDLGLLVGRLICSHVFACQPELERSVRFAERLADELRPSNRSLAIAKAKIERQMEVQRVQDGPDVSLTVPW